jgi:serine/threonine protein kinase
MELVNGVSLLTFLKSKTDRKLDIEECKMIFEQIVLAVDHLHRRSICHRDLKLENILIDEFRTIKLIDFGFGTVTTGKRLDFFCGTPSYMPPEIVQKKDYVGIISINLGESADVWSLGILLYALLCGAFPFRAMNERELYNKIIKGIYMNPNHLNTKTCEFIARILNISPTNRPTANEVIFLTYFRF